MGSESSAKGLAQSSSKQGTIVPNCSPNRFAVAAKALWPRKTAAELAYRAHVSERLAKYWLSGDRDPSTDALLVIFNEIRGKRRA